MCKNKVTYPKDMTVCNLHTVFRNAADDWLVRRIRRGFVFESSLDIGSGRGKIGYDLGSFCASWPIYDDHNLSWREQKTHLL